MSKNGAELEPLLARAAAHDGALTPATMPALLVFGSAVVGPPEEAEDGRAAPHAQEVHGDEKQR